MCSKNLYSTTDKLFFPFQINRCWHHLDYNSLMMQYIHTLLYFITTDRTFLAARFRFSPLSTSLHYYNINISLQIFSTNTVSLSLIRTSGDGTRDRWEYFFAQKGSNCSTQSRKRNETCAVESGVVWLRGKTEDTSDSPFPVLVFFQPPAGRRCSFARETRFPASLLVESWFMGRSFLRERSNLRHPTRYRLLRTPPHDTFSFRCFVVSTLYAIATNGLKSKMVLKSLLLAVETTYMHLWQRDRMHFILHRMWEMWLLLLHFSFTSRWELENDSRLLPSVRNLSQFFPFL